MRKYMLYLLVATLYFSTTMRPKQTGGGNSEGKVVETTKHDGNSSNVAGAEQLLDKAQHLILQICNKTVDVAEQRSELRFTGKTDQQLKIMGEAIIKDGKWKMASLKENLFKNLSSSAPANYQKECIDGALAKMFVANKTANIKFSSDLNAEQQLLSWKGKDGHDCTLIRVKNASYLLLVGSPPMLLDNYGDLVKFGCINDGKGGSSKMQTIDFYSTNELKPMWLNLTDEHDDQEDEIDIPLATEFFWTDVGTMMDIVFFTVFILLLVLMVGDMLKIRLPAGWKRNLSPIIISMGEFQTIFERFKYILRTNGMIGRFHTDGNVCIERGSDMDDASYERGLKLMTDLYADEVSIIIQDYEDGSGRAVELLLLELLEEVFYDED